MGTETPPISSTAPTPGPWQELRDEISSLSEEIYCAGWLYNIEHLVWKWLEDPATAPALARDRLPRLRQLAEDGGHWVRWDDGRPGPYPVIPVHLDRWRRRHAEWLTARSPEPPPINLPGM